MVPPKGFSGGLGQDTAENIVGLIGKQNAHKQHNAWYPTFNTLWPSVRWSKVSILHTLQADADLVSILLKVESVPFALETDFPTKFDRLAIPNQSQIRLSRRRWHYNTVVVSARVLLQMDAISVLSGSIHCLMCS